MFERDNVTSRMADLIITNNAGNFIQVQSYSQVLK